MSKPFVSIIIPCYNEEKHIKKCLKSVIENDYPDDKMEIFVIDGRSKDKTREIVEKYIEKYNFIHLLDNPEKTVPYALNKGINKAKGNYIIRMDAHSEYPEDYILTLVYYHKKLNADNVGGSWDICPANKNIMARSIAYASASPFGVGNAMYRLDSKEIKQVDTVPFGCYKREVFDKNGLFDTDLVRNQDDEFNARLIQNGGKIFLIPFLKIKYTARPNIRKIAKMFYQYALYKPLVNKKLKYPATIRQFIPPAFILYLLFFVIVLITGFYAIIFSVPLIVYFVVSIIFSVKESVNKKDKGALILMPLIYFIIHLSYGFGYFAGLLKFRLKN